MENGKIAIARGLENGLGCGTTEFHVLRPFGGILSEYIYRYLRQESFRRAAAANMSGTAGQLRVPADYIKSVELPLAPLAEQRRIVAKIEALFEQSRAARQALDRIPPLLKKFRQSILASAFRGDFTRDWREQHPDIEPASVLLERIRAERLRRYQEEVKKAKAEGRRLPRRPTTTALAKVAESARFDAPKGWEWATISDLVTPDLGGRPFVTSGSRGWAKYYSTTGDKFIRSENINTNHLRLDDAVCVQVPRGGEAERTRVSPGDVLLTITGNNIGRAATVPRGVSQAYVSQHVAIIRLDKSIQPEYVWLWLMAEVTGQRQLRGFYYGQTKPGLSLEQIKAVAIALPPESEQHVIINRVKELSVLADHIEKRLAEAWVRVNKLDQSILARAFRGELVSQDPNDEPAAILLGRIRVGNNANRKGNQVVPGDRGMARSATSIASV
jgi:type I restriction enzyme S subunit